MAENVTRLPYQDKELILVSTAHISEASVALVKETIENERPDSVCIELDEGRYQTIQNPKAWEETDVTRVIREKKVGFMLVQLIISTYQKNLAKKLGTKVGGEMIQGIESAKEVGAEIVLADRSVQVTFGRIWRLLGVKEKLKLLYILLFMGSDDEEGELTEEDLTAMLEKDMLESAIGEISDELPIISQVLITERDQYLANKIKNAPGEKVLAVLGGAHVPGVKEEIYKEQDLETITTVPKKKSRLKYLAWIIPIVMVALIVIGFTRGADVGMQNLLSWWLWNGGLAALFALIALGHPLSILTAFVAAPFTTLNPFLAAGFFAGLVEAWIRKPTVEDMQNIPEDVFRFKGYYQNRFLKILVIVVVTNLGSAIGTFVAGADIISNLFW